MKTRILAAALIAALSQTAFADGDAYWNNVQGSFDNMLNHEPYTGPTEVTVARGETDPVAVMLQAMVRETNQPATARSIDLYRNNVSAAFGRMLDHSAYAGQTGVTVPRQLDHRVDRLVLAMRNSRPAAIDLAAVQQ